MRNYNEDRISIVLDLRNPKLNSSNPEGTKQVKYFALFDGHGGLGCAEFLRDNLHNFIAASEYFPH